MSNMFNFFAGYGEHIFFQLFNGTLCGVGKNTHGQLSLGSELSKVVEPKSVLAFPPGTKKEVVKIAVGKSHTLFLTKSAGAKSCGRNRNGQLSDATKRDRFIAVDVQYDEEEDTVVVRDVICGYSCSYFLTRRGSVYSAGTNEKYCLGLPDQPLGRPVTVARKIASLFDVVKLVSGDRWAMCLSKGNRVFSWGGNVYNQLGFRGGAGDRDSTQRNNPKEITFFRDKNIKIDLLRASEITAYFITSDNQVYCAGSNHAGEYGIGEGSDSSCGIPVLSPGLSNFELFSAGFSAGHVITRKNGRFFGTGYERNSFGCDHSPGAHRYHAFLPEEITFLNDKEIVQVVLGYRNSYAISKSGEVYVAGKASDGQAMCKAPVVKLEQFTRVGKFKLRKSKRVKIERGERIELMVRKYAPLVLLVVFAVNL